MNSFTITYNLIYQFKEANNYKVSKCGKVFNTRTNRQIKKCYNSGSVGYWINKKFIIIPKDKSTLERIPKVRCPF